MYVENDFNFFSIWFLQKLKIKIAAIDYLYRMSTTRVPPGVPPGVPPPHDGSHKSAVHINRRSKLTVIPPGGPPGVPPPHDGSLVADGGKPVVHINRRSKLTVIPPKDDSGDGERGVEGGGDGAVGCGGAVGHGGAVGCGGSAVGGAVSGDVITYISSLSPLEQHVCRIAESHLESSFDILRSTGYIAWKAKNA